MQLLRKLSGGILVLTSLVGVSLPAVVTADSEESTVAEKTVHIKVLAPERKDVAGVGSRGFIVDLVAEFEGDLASTGASLELTGPGPLANAGPFPGTFSLGANQDHFPGLVVLLSSTQVGVGAGHNLANLFNIVSVTHRDEEETYVWTTWIIGAPNAFGKVGELTPSRLFVAVVGGAAPDVVEDMNADGRFDKKDLKLMGYKLLSNTPKVDFVVNGYE